MLMCNRVALSVWDLSLADGVSDSVSDILSDNGPQLDVDFVPRTLTLDSVAHVGPSPLLTASECLARVAVVPLPVSRPARSRMQAHGNDLRCYVWMDPALSPATNLQSALCPETWEIDVACPVCVLDTACK